MRKKCLSSDFFFRRVRNRPNSEFWDYRQNYEIKIIIPRLKEEFWIKRQYSQNKVGIWYFPYQIPYNIQYKFDSYLTAVVTSPFTIAFNSAGEEGGRT